MRICSDTFRSISSLLLLLGLITGLSIQAQTPQTINYQAIIRSNSGTAVVNQAVSLRFTIYDGSPSGPSLFGETHSTTTNAFGLVNLQIGGGSVLFGSMSGVNWSSGSKYLQVEVDISGGNSYTSLGATQLVAVPYALHAQTVSSSNAVTQLTAGNGINVSNPTGNTTVGANYGGDGSAITLSRSDHTHVGQSWTSTLPSLLTLTTTHYDPRGIYVIADGASSVTASAIKGEVRSTTGLSVGVWGETYSSGFGAGVFGLARNAGQAKGVMGYATGSNTSAVYGYAAAAFGTNIKAGEFDGPVVINGPLTVNGALSKSSGSFKIDHPLDPANKNLYHSFVESPDMMNVYNGNITLDAQGEATVLLPDWFEALNKDFRYQLTAIGRPSPNVYVADEIAGNRFRIAGGTPGAKISWQVTGIRKDKYADQHRTPIEEEKSAEEKAAYGKPAATSPLRF